MVLFGNLIRLQRVKFIAMKTHHAITSITAVIALLAITSTALAENGFQLPRECSERQNVDLPQCVIQDGPPRVPWVHGVNRISAGAKTQNTSAAGASPSSAPAQTPSVRTAPPR